MKINNKQVLLSAFLLVALSSSFVDAASVRDNSEKSKNFLRRELTEGASRKHKSKSNKGGGGGGGGGVPTPAPPTPAPIKTVTSIEDWNKGCPSGSNKIQDCVNKIVGGPATPVNCKLCLKSLSFTSNPVASSPGVDKCAESVTCQGCSADDIRPFFACGLKVDDDFNGISPVFPITAAATGALVTTDLSQKGSSGIFGFFFVGAAVCYFAVMALQNYQRRKDYQKVSVASETASLITN